MADPAPPIECSSQPLGLSFHPTRRLVAAGLVDGSIEFHDFNEWPERMARSKEMTNTNKKMDTKKMGGSSDDDDEEDDTILATLPAHVNDIGPKTKQKPSCRSVLFSDHEPRLFAAGNGGGLAALDVERICSSSLSDLMEATSGDNDDWRKTFEVWNIDGASPNGINRLFQLPENSPAGRLLVTGDDEGVVRLWDERMCGSNGGSSASAAASSAPVDTTPKGCVLSWSNQKDYISGFDAHKDGTTLLASSADCTLGVYDVRKSAVNNSAKPNKAPVPRLSDDQEDELLSICTIKHGRKVVCGSDQGVLSVWSWGTWGDVSDRFPGHPNSIDALLKIDEDTLLTGSGDGLIRIVQIQPDKLLGVLGVHNGFPVECLRFSSNREYVASLSHDALIRMWDGSLLHDDDSNEEDDNDEKADDEKGDAVEVMKKTGGAGLTRAGAESDDEWDDDDDDDDDSDEEQDNGRKPSAKDESNASSDSDDCDSDDDDNRGGKKPRLFKTEAEKFFEDL
jgi:WD40 repeat protein